MRPFRQIWQQANKKKEKLKHHWTYIVSYLLRYDVESGFLKKEMNIFRNLAIRETHEKTQIF
jgi:hypothetical protein